MGNRAVEQRTTHAWNDVKHGKKKHSKQDSPSRPTPYGLPWA